MIGAAAMAFVVVVVLMVGLPVMFMVSGTLIAMIIGQHLWRDGETRFEGDERVELNT